MIIIYTDGGARNNPGPAGAGAVICDGERKLAELKKFLGIRTNNWAEYEAVLLALKKAKELRLEGEKIEFRLDSKLVVEQLLGHWKVKEPTLKPQVAKIKTLLHGFGAVNFVHIPREKNKEADALVNEALDQMR